MNLALPIQEQFRRFINPHVAEFFKQAGALEQFEPDRVSVRADLDVYKWKEDAFIWGQKKEKLHKVYQVYFDDKFICYIQENTSMSQTMLEFWNGFLKAYELPDNNPGKIWLNKSIYADKVEEQKQKDKKQQEAVIKSIKDKKVTNEIEAQAKEIALDVAKQAPDAS